jgi:hypothetical protein
MIGGLLMTRQHVTTRLAAASAALLLMLDVGTAAAQPLRYMSCGELWYARNAIYAQSGYCFQTSRAIRVFGRACFPPYGRLSAYEQRRVNEITAWERRKGCN